MRFRAVLPAVLLAGLLVPSSVGAAAKACNLVVDRKGDVRNTIAGPAEFPADNSLDIASADVASSATAITAVLRMANPVTGSQLYDRRWVVEFKAAGSRNPLVLAALIDITGASSFMFGYTAPSETGGTSYFYPGDATGKIVGKDITVTAKFSDMKAIPEVGAIKPRAVLSQIKASTFRRVNAVARGQLFAADDAPTKRTYVAGTASCVRVG